jgi:hypothetical protein
MRQLVAVVGPHCQKDHLWQRPPASEKNFGETNFRGRDGDRISKLSPWEVRIVSLAKKTNKEVTVALELSERQRRTI